MHKLFGLLEAFLPVLHMYQTVNDQLTAVTEGEASGNNDELITTFRDCSKERISSKQFDRKSNLGTIGATIIEGEASETDEELEVPTKTISVMPLDCELKVLENPRRFLNKSK
uniref:Uncharacterized protein n=1 Tax=Heterorhabditis bacteriophora TaxID=37862 RepID=A0A1I7WL05_HETBA